MSYNCFKNMFFSLESKNHFMSALLSRQENIEENRRLVLEVVNHERT